jgi:hypothetical protein
MANRFRSALMVVQERAARSEKEQDGAAKHRQRPVGNRPSR